MGLNMIHSVNLCNDCNHNDYTVSHYYTVSHAKQKKCPRKKKGTCEARQVNVKTIIILHLQFVYHERPVYRDAVWLPAFNRQTVKLYRWKAEAVGGGIVPVD
jgi:hypothetical protein